MPSAETRRGTIYFTDHRKMASPYTPVMLIHGAGGTHLDWSPHIRKLPEANTIAPDLPGHGKSGGNGRRNISDYAQDMMALADALGLERVIICGQSMGGAIAQQMALDYCERIAGVILIATGAKLRVHPDILERVLTDYEQVARLLVSWYWSEGVDEATRQRSYDSLMKFAPEVLYGDYLACDAFDIREKLTQITAPTLVIGATEDKLAPLKYSQYLAEHIPNANLVIVEETGHMLHLEKPTIVSSAMQAWQNKLHQRMEN